MTTATGRSAIVRYGPIVVGVVAVLAFIEWPVALVLGLIAILLSLASRPRNTAGLVLGIVAIVLTMVVATTLGTLGSTTSRDSSSMVTPIP